MSAHKMIQCRLNKDFNNIALKNCWPRIDKLKMWKAFDKRRRNEVINNLKPSFK